MDRIPLFFNRSILVAGHGFVARVKLEGRCILERTGDRFVSFFGVNPGALAGQGHVQSEAYRDFAENLRLVIEDFASEAADFDEFKDLVQQFVHDTNQPFEEAWHEAVEKVRAGKADRSAYPVVHSSDRPASVDVELVASQQSGKPKANRTLGPDLNRQGEEEALVAVG